MTEERLAASDGTAPDAFASAAALARRLLPLLAILAAAALTAWLLFTTAQALLLVFVAVVLALVLDTLAKPLERLRLPRRAARLLVLLAVPVVAGGVGWLLWSSITQQFSALDARLVAAFNGLSAWAGTSGWASQALQSVQLEQLLPAARKLVGGFGTVLSAVGSVLFVIALSAFIAFDPELYKRGFVRLIPQPHRELWDGMLKTMTHALRSWLLGRVSSMVVYGVLMGLGLAVVGYPSAGALAFIAGVCAFVPYFGALAGAIPALLVGVTEGPRALVEFAVVFTIAQALQDYAFDPILQRWVASLPPALLLSSQVALGIIAGAPGAIIAEPLLVVVMVAVQILYVRGVLGDRDLSPLGARGRGP